MATKRDLLKAIRMFCSECMGGPRATKNVWPVKNPADIADCTAPECIWFSYRFGRDPDKRILSPAQQAHLAKMRRTSLQIGGQKKQGERSKP